MDMRELGHSGIQVSVVGVGTNAFGVRIDQAQSGAVVSAALDAGINFFDTADVYGLGASEEALGAALGSRRDNVVIASKFGRPMKGVNGDDGGRRGSAEYVRTALDATLKRLGTDYLDLFQYHTRDPQTPLEETLGALDELVSEGKVRAIGCSNLQAWELVDADWLARSSGFTRFATAQNEYSLYNRTAEVELAPACEHLNVGILPYFPLAFGLLTDKYHQFTEPAAGTRLAEQRARFEAADWSRIDQLRAFAQRHDISMLELAIGGLAAQRAMASVIAGATTAEQVAANAAAGRWKPTPEQLAELAEIGRPTQSYTTYAKQPDAK
jgi:aryl-alcohol dehydrogenase-like predicted oxidoreductase